MQSNAIFYMLKKQYKDRIDTKDGFYIEAFGNKQDIAFQTEKLENFMLYGKVSYDMKKTASNKLIHEIRKKVKKAKMDIFQKFVETQSPLGFFNTNCILIKWKN
jgi:hypothetical protein